MKFCNKMVISKRLAISSFFGVLSLLPVSVMADQLTCHVENVLATSGSPLDAKMARLIKDNPLILDLSDGAIEHPVWGTDKFKATKMVDQDIREGQTVVLSRTKAGEISTNEDVDFMIDIEAQTDKVSSFLIAAKVPAGIFAKGHCSQVD